MNTPYIIVLVTTANKQQAEKIVQSLLESKLIACGNIIGPVTSLFRWSEQPEKIEEYVALMKSRKDLFEEISKKVKAFHSYDVPEILALELVDGSRSYLDWIESCLR